MVTPRRRCPSDLAGASWAKQGNDGSRQHDNHLVHPSVELMEVIGDLCRLAAAFLLVGDTAWTETLIEQCGELLAHRARLVTRFPGGRIRGPRWTN